MEPARKEPLSIRKYFLFFKPFPIDDQLVSCKEIGWTDGMMGSVIINSSGSITMKVKVWLTIVAVVGIWMSGCSKSKSLSPEDTALIKGTDRGNFVSVTGVSGDQEDEFSPIGDQINGANGSDGLAPQDPFWSDDALSQGERPSSRSFLDLINTISVRMSVPNYRM